MLSPCFAHIRDIIPLSLENACNQQMSVKNLFSTTTLSALKIRKQKDDRLDRGTTEESSILRLPWVY